MFRFPWWGTCHTNWRHAGFLGTGMLKATCKSQCGWDAGSRCPCRGCSRSLLAQRAPGYQLRRLPRQKSQPAATAWQGKVLGYATGGSPPPRLLKATMAHSRSACCIATSWWKILLIVELKFIGCYSRKSTSKNDQLWQFRCVRKIKGWDPMNRQDGLALAHTCRYGLQSKTGMCNSDPQDCFM